MNQDNFNERLEMLIEALGHNKNSFSKEIGLDNNVVIGRLVKEIGRKPSFEILARILKTFPEVNPSWLILGQGEMTRKEPDDIPSFAIRVSRIMEYLKLTPSDMSDRTGIPVNIFTDIVSRNTPEETDIAISKKITDAFPEINREWLERNNLPMFTNTGVILRSFDEKTFAYVGDEYYKIEEAISKTGITILSHHSMRIAGMDDCDVAIRVVSDSMKPEISPNDIAVLKCTDKDLIIYGETYLVQFKDQYRIGIVKESGKKIVLESLNEKYSPIEIPKQDITRLLMVKAIIKRMS